VTSENPSLLDEQLAAIVGLIPGGGAIVPSLERLSQRVRHESARRRSVALRAAEARAGCSREQLAEQIANDPRLVPLLTRVLFAAGMNGQDETLHLLGSALGLAVSARDRIDEAQLVLDAIERLGGLELELLNSMAEQRDRGKDAFTASDVLQVASPRSERLARLALSGLLAKGLVEAVSGYGTLVYELTPLSVIVREVILAHRAAT